MIFERQNKATLIFRFFSIFALLCIIAGCPDTTTPPPAENSAPSDIVLAETSIVENQVSGTVIGSLSVIDSDSGDTHFFLLADGFGDNGSFTIDGTELRTAAALDYDTKSSYSIKIIVSDGTDDFSKEFTIGINRSIETIEWQDDGTGWLQYSTNDSEKDDENAMHIDVGSHDFTSDAVFKFQTKRISGSTWRNYGLIFCADMANGNTYIFNIDNTGKYIITKFQSGEQVFWGEDLADPDDYSENSHTNRPHPAIKTTNGEINEFRIERTGDGLFEITINNNTDNIIHLNDDRGGSKYSSGTFGFNIIIGGDFPNYPLDVHFREINE